MEITYYSYKEIIPDSPGIETKSFIAPALDEGEELVYLGKYKDRHYITLPKTVQIGEQLPECDVQHYDQLPEEAEFALMSEGSLAQSLNIKQSLSELKDPANIDIAVAYELAEIRTSVRALAELLSALVSSVPVTMSVDDRSASSGKSFIISPGSMSILNKLTGSAQSVKDELSKAGL